MGERSNIFYDKIIDERRCLFTKDSYNWIWMHGPKDSSIDTILRNSNNKFFYTSIESMLKNLLEKRFRAHVTRLTIGNFRKSLKKAHRDVIGVAKVNLQDFNEVWLALEAERARITTLLEKFKELEGRLDGTTQESKENHSTT